MVVKKWDSAFTESHFSAFCGLSDGNQTGIYGAEHVANHWAKDHEDRDRNDGDQNKNQGIFNKALTFLFESR